MMEALDSDQAVQEANTAGGIQSKWSKPVGYDYTTMDGPERGNFFDGNARVYEWDGEEGEIGPEHPELELELFGNPEDRTEVKGLDFSAYVVLFLTRVLRDRSDLELVGLQRSM